MEAFRLKNKIFGYFNPSDYKNDPNKINGKGTDQRFNEMLAEDWDLNILPKIESLSDNIYTDLPDKFIPYMEFYWGLESPLVDNMETRRKILKYLPTIYKTKGTLNSYKILFQILGFSFVEIEDIQVLQSFDSPYTFDDENRVFDKGNCPSCTKYILKLKGPMQMTEDLYQIIIKAVALVEPINAKLYSITYNNSEVTFTIFVRSNGDLVYSVIGLYIKFELFSNGDLYINDSDAANYYLKNGNLLKN